MSSDRNESLPIILPPLTHKCQILDLLYQKLSRLEFKRAQQVAMNNSKYKSQLFTKNQKPKALPNWIQIECAVKAHQAMKQRDLKLIDKQWAQLGLNLDVFAPSQLDEEFGSHVEILSSKNEEILKKFGSLTSLDFNPLDLQNVTIDDIFNYKRKPGRKQNDFGNSKSNKSVSSKEVEQAKKVLDLKEKEKQKDAQKVRFEKYLKFIRFAGMKLALHCLNEIKNVGNGRDDNVYWRVYEQFLIFDEYTKGFVDSFKEDFDYVPQEGVQQIETEVPLPKDAYDVAVVQALSKRQEKKEEKRKKKNEKNESKSKKNAKKRNLSVSQSTDDRKQTSLLSFFGPKQKKQKKN